MPKPSEDIQDAPSAPSLKDRVEYAADCFNANNEPERAFNFLRRVHRLIISKDIQTKAAREILKIITPIISLHAPHELEGVSLSKTLRGE